MKLKHILLLSFLSIRLLADAQKPCASFFKDSASVSNELKQLVALDQKYRTQYYLGLEEYSDERDSIETLQAEIDQQNSEKLKNIINKYDYNCLASFYYKQYIAALLLHMPQNDLNDFYFPKMLLAIKAQKQLPFDYAYLIDMMCFRKGENQVYGTFQCGEKILCPLDDKRKVNEQRASIGLNTIEEYCSQNGFILP